MLDPPDETFIRVAVAKEKYLGGAMSLHWWYKQVERGVVPHFRAGGAVLLRPCDVEAFVAGFYREKAEPVKAPAPPRAKSRPAGGGLRFFGR